MKILHILEPLSYGGVEKMVLNLIKNHSKIGYKCVVALPYKMNHGLISDFENYAEIIYMSYDNPYNIIRITREYKKIIKNVDPDIIHTHARRPMTYLNLANKDTIHIRTYHMEEQERIRKTRFEKYLTRKKVDGWAVTWKGIIRKDLSEMSIDKNKSRVIYNGVDKINVDKKMDDKLNFLLIGRLSYQKGIDILLEALAKLDKKYKNKIKLTIVGEGELKDELNDLVLRYNLKNMVNFEGFQTDISKYYGSSDVFLMPSRYEGLPLSLIESLSSGTPVISSKVGAMQEIIINGYNGKLVEENTPKFWTEAILEAINMKGDFSYYENCVSTYDKYFRVDDMCKNYERFYLELLKRKTNASNF